MALKLYQITYKPMYSVGGGRALVLASSKERALVAWTAHPKTPLDFNERIERIDEITDEHFYDGSVLINDNGDY